MSDEKFVIISTDFGRYVLFNDGNNGGFSQTKLLITIPSGLSVSSVGDDVCISFKGAIEYNQFIRFCQAVVKNAEKERSDNQIWK